MNIQLTARQRSQASGITISNPEYLSATNVLYFDRVWKGARFVIDGQGQHALAPKS